MDDANKYVIKGRGELELFHVLEESYNVIVSSVVSSIPKISPTIEPAGPEHQVGLSLGPSSSSSASDAGPSGFVCGICMEPRDLTQSFQNGSCPHRFCLDCTQRYIAVRIKENVTVQCPESGCRATIDADRCQGIIPVDVFERWSAILAESVIQNSNRFYCPYQDCSALMEDEGKTVIEEAVCPHCRRLFCARCRVAWHAGVGCDEFQRLESDESGRNDILLKNLAEKNSWQRCPACMFYVEKTDGCLHIKCRCGVHFCYKCGSSWNEYHCC